MNVFKLSTFTYWSQLIVMVLIMLGYGAYRYFAYYDTRSTDAYVSANMVNISSLISGPITRIYIQDNQKVKKGDPLLELDPLPYLYAVQEAKAKVDFFGNSTTEEHCFVDTVLESSCTNVYTPVLRSVSPRTSLSVANFRRSLVDKAKGAQDIAVAQAALAKANYFLKHTVLRAPEDGYITNFTLRSGQYVKAGEGLFALVESKHWWVITRYRETAIRLIRPGDKATISLAMYPGTLFHGQVESIGWGINRVQQGNSSASTLPYIEATEDWIRITQRFPVRISITDPSEHYPLRIGASATTVTYR